MPIEGFNHLLAKVTVLLGVLAVVGYVFRIEILKKYHKYFGMAMVVTGFIHGYISYSIFADFQFGHIVWLLTVLLILSKSLGKKYKKNWLKVHQGLAISLVITLVIHLSII